MAAAVGSFIILSTLKPAISPAFFVAFLCISLKLAGTVITASSTSSPKKYSATSFNFFKISAEISSGLYSFP